MQRRQFTGAAAAAALGVTERTIRNWLAGDTKIPHHLKGRLSR